MATTNNVQGDEPLRSTALERQVQTLMTAVERLTKQNHNLEEQLHQRDVGHNVQEDNQEDSSERGEPERLEGSNAPSRLERQNLSLPSFMDAPLSPIIAKMQAMNEQMKVMMNTLKERMSSNLDDLVNKTDSSFTPSINSFALPQKFRMPQIESYDGVKDPLNHLETFKTLMHLQGVPDKIMCKAFPTTLKGPARVWFSRLTSSSINTFKELNAQFTSHFIGGH